MCVGLVHAHRCLGDFPLFISVVLWDLDINVIFVAKCSAIDSNLQKVAALLWKSL